MLQRWLAGGPATWRRVAFPAVFAAVFIGFQLHPHTAHARSLEPVTFAALGGWNAEALGDAFAAFHQSCAAMVESGRSFSGDPRYAGTRTDWLDACRAALSMPEAVSDSAARDFFETRFRPLRVSGEGGSEGLFTGYFEPEVDGARTAHGPYRVPLYRKPEDFRQPYLTRAEIERGALSGRGLELVWLTSLEDAFFLHIQGSGRVRLPDGGVMRVGFAAKNGRPYTPIGRILVADGEIPRDEISMQSIRTWLEANPDRAQPLMWRNESFIFFQEVAAARPDLGPRGAQNVPLTPGRSLAVDRAFYALGTPIWLETRVPAGPDNALVPMRRLMVAQDTGTAIKGAVRGDVFWGAGERAAAIAGRMQSAGRMTILVPRAAAARLAR